jgi:hypothetical protein
VPSIVSISNSTKSAVTTSPWSSSWTDPLATPAPVLRLNATQSALSVRPDWRITTLPRPM